MGEGVGGGLFVAFVGFSCFGRGAEVAGALIDATGFQPHEPLGFEGPDELGGVCPALAIRFEAAGVGTAKLWLDMQTAYDLARAREAGEPVVEKLVG